MLSSISFGMAHNPAGAGRMVPPISAWPSNRIEMNALRSSASASARRISILSKGGAHQVTMMLERTLEGKTQAPEGVCVVERKKARSKINGNSRAAPYDKNKNSTALGAALHRK